MSLAFRQYFLHADFSFFDLASNWAGFLAALGAAAGLAALAWRAGSRLLLFLGCRRRAVSPARALAIGFGAMATAVLGFGLAGLLYFPPRGVSTAALAALAAWHIAQHRREISFSWAAESLRAVSLPTRIILVLALAIACAGVFNLEISWDALSYHLRLPTFFIYRHKIYSVWHHLYSPFPSLIEMLYLLGLAAQGEQAVRLLNFLLGILFLFTARSLAKSMGGSGRLAVLLIMASPLFLMLATRSYIDLGFALFFAVSLERLHRWWSSGSRAALAESALLAGLGMSSKYVGVLFLPALLAAAGFRPPHRAIRPGSLRLASIWIALAFTPLAAWLAKNWLFTANPVSPMLGGVFGTHESHPFNFSIAFGPDRSLPGILASLPAGLSVLFFDDGLVDGPLTAAVGCALPLVFLRTGSPDLRFLRRSVLVYALGWWLLCPHVRYLLPVIPALCVLVEFGLGTLIASAAAPFRLFRILFEAGLAAGVLYAASTQWVFFGPFSFMLGLENKESRLIVGLPPPPFHYYAREFINESTPASARILQVANFSSYFIERECISDFHFGRAHITKIIRDAGSPDEIGRRFKRLGIRWLLHSSSGIRQYLRIPGFFDVPERDWAIFKEFLATRTRIAWQTDGYTLSCMDRNGAPRPCPDFPAYETIRFHRADQDLSQGRVEEALSAFLRPPDLLADVGSTYIRQADAFMLLGRFAEAELAFRRALKLGADVPRVQIGLAQIYLRTGRFSRALEHALNARRENPRSGYAAATLAVIYHQLGRMDSARENIRLAERLSPDREDYKQIARNFERQNIR